MTADLILRKRHGYCELAPQTDAGREFVADPRFKTLRDFDHKSILLDSFFANAGDWVRMNVMPHEHLTVQWGDSVYQGEAGAEALWEECA